MKFLYDFLSLNSHFRIILKELRTWLGNEKVPTSSRKKFFDLMITLLMEGDLASIWQRTSSESAENWLRYSYDNLNFKI